ncbi:MAG TPA: Tad domain-containing protein [Acidimicrobiia bacterium]|nr:Tad domain-containing protein [Acidimicrobiia bacterium]
MLTNSSSDRGATALLIALCLLLIMGMAAFAIDISAAKNERRLDQNGADASVLAGALEYALGGSAQSVVDTAKAYVATNVRAVPAGDWAACTDPDALPLLSSSIPGITGGSACISFQFGPDDALMRVRVPNQQTDTTFGRVLGVTQIDTFAFAEATIFETSNGAFPAGVFSSVGPGAEVCIKTGTAGGRDSCGASTTGDFGNFNPYFYTELSSGPQSSLCNSGNQPQPLSRAIADGLDHRLGTTPSAPGNRVNGGDCPGFPGPLNPNRVDSGGGYSNNDVTDGMITGGSWPSASDNFSGRLRRGPYVDGSFEIFGRDIDNKPLWEYIDTSLPMNATCQNAAAQNPTDATSVIAAEAIMKTCLATESGQIFSADLANTMRLATVPQYHQSAPLGSNVCCYDIANFVPVFIQGLWTEFGAQWTCNGVFIDPTLSFCMHEPGMNGDIDRTGGPGQQKIDSASAIVLGCHHLPPPLCQVISGGGSAGNQFYELELTR